MQQTNPKPRSANLLSADEREYSRFFEVLFEKSGYDFRNYSPAYLKRRIERRCLLAGIRDLEDFAVRVLHEEEFFEVFLSDLSICVTELFRTPAFFSELRLRVIPYLATHPQIRVWTAGCATGEEAYSLAILLHEEGLADRAVIYATDISCKALRTAREGAFASRNESAYRSNYEQSGGKAKFSDYFTPGKEFATFHSFLRQKIVFSEHNLATDASFGEMHMILCRNVLIYFDLNLHTRVFKLFSDSLYRQGFLGIGERETISPLANAHLFEPFDSKHGIFRKAR